MLALGSIRRNTTGNEAALVGSVHEIQGPILEVLFSQSELIKSAAQRRLRAAKNANNRNYRIVMVPPGLNLSAEAMPWLAKKIHGWALTSLND